MTKEAAIQTFFSQFGIPAYASTSVLEDVTFPFLVHDFPIAEFGDQVSGTVQLRYYTESEAIPNAKADEIFNAIGRGGKRIRCDEGVIWLKRGSPFKINAPQDQSTEEARFLKTKQLNITAEFHTID